MSSNKDIILSELDGCSVYKVDIDSSATMRGRPATKVTVYIEADMAKAEFLFAKDNKMQTKDMATVIRSYLTPHRMRTAKALSKRFRRST